MTARSARAVAARRPAANRGPTTTAPAIRAGSRAARHDPRWPAIVAALAALRERGRCAVRIVDADCGAGCLLLETARHARAIGFTAIEGHGIDGSPALIGRARAAATRFVEPAAGIDFEIGDIVECLRAEAECPADMVIWHGPASEPDGAVPSAVAAAGRVAIGDPARPARQAR